MSDKPHVILDYPYYKPAMDRLVEICTPHLLSEAEDKDAVLAEFGPQAKAICAPGLCETALMDACPDAKLISSFGVGYDGIDIAAATARGVKVTNTPDVLNDCVADLALGLVLSTRRRIVEADVYTRAGRWVSEGNFPYVQKVHGSKVGIVGLGRIGMEIAARCSAFKMDIAYHKRTKRDDVPFTYYADLVAMARDCDILIVITPGGAETLNLINAEVIDALGPKGLLVNVARGSVVDTDALIAALKEGRLGAAGLDVFPDEPNVPAALLEMTENVVLTPHVASASHETRMEMGMLVYKNLEAHLKGEPLLTPVN